MNSSFLMDWSDVYRRNSRKKNRTKKNTTEKMITPMPMGRKQKKWISLYMALVLTVKKSSKGVNRTVFKNVILIKIEDK